MFASFTALESFLSRQNLVFFFLLSRTNSSEIRVFPMTHNGNPRPPFLFFSSVSTFERATTPLDEIESGFGQRKSRSRIEVSEGGGVVLRILLTCYTIEGDRAVSREASRAPQASKGTLTTLVAAKRLGRRHPATTYPTIRKTKQKPMYPADPMHVAFLPEFIPC